MKWQPKRWHVIGLLIALVLVALAEIAGGDWWSIYYAKYLAGIDNAYLNSEGSVCFTPATQNTKATPAPEVENFAVVTPEAAP